MSMVKVTSEQLAELGGQLAQGSTQVEDQLNTMRSRVEPLVAGEWEGAASGAFHQSWDEWAQAANQLKEALDTISSLLIQASRVYQEAEDNVRSSMTAR